jgi:hypothetical protein
VLGGVMRGRLLVALALGLELVGRDRLGEHGGGNRLGRRRRRRNRRSRRYLRWRFPKTITITDADAVIRL